MIQDVRNTQGVLADMIHELHLETSRVKYIAQADYDDVKNLTNKLYELRERASYKKAFEGKPLISIRIATYNRADTLINTAIASVLKQTYQNFEIVIVGDHCTDDTEEKLAKLKDKRIRFYNLPNRTVYPENSVLKWRVIGTPAMNLAANMAKGEWIAPLDDDDEFTPDHLEKLIDKAKATKSEMVYGAMIQKNLVTGKEKKLWSSPPRAGEFSFHNAIYMKLLNEIFKYDFKTWVMDEVNDWNMCRRMMESGVKISAIEDVVGTANMIPPGHEVKDY